MYIDEIKLFAKKKKNRRLIQIIWIYSQEKNLI